MVGFDDEPADPVLESMAIVAQENDCRRRRLVLKGLLQDVELLMGRDDGMTPEEKQQQRRELLGVAVLRSSMNDSCGFTITVSATKPPSGMCVLPEENCPMRHETGPTNA